jgi:hypothetical protein
MSNKMRTPKTDQSAIPDISQALGIFRWYVSLTPRFSGVSVGKRGAETVLTGFAPQGKPLKRFTAIRGVKKKRQPANNERAKFPRQFQFSDLLPNRWLILHVAQFGGQFSLPLEPSPLGRGNRLRGAMANQGPRLLTRPAARLHLSRGEGQGEGEESVAYPTVSVPPISTARFVRHSAFGHLSDFGFRYLQFSA